MSLTSMLSNPSSPLRQFLAAEMPNVGAVRASYRAARPAGVDTVIPLAPDGGKPAWGTLGAAIDHRLRYVLSDVVSRDGAVSNGIELSGTIGRSAPVARALHAAGVALLDEIERLLGKHRPFDRSQPALLPQEIEDQLSRACYAAALYEEVYRTGKVWPGTLLGDAGADFDLDELLTGVPSYAVEDIAAVVGLADAGLASVRSACTPAEVFAGPTFAGSQDVGGADADWIAAGLLVDVKSTAKLDRLDPNHVYQLAGYALLDYDDRYQIERVGWYLTRAGWLVTWDLAEFVALLGTSRPVAELRERVADVLHR